MTLVPKLPMVRMGGFGLLICFFKGAASYVSHWLEGHHLKAIRMIRLELILLLS